MTVAVIAYVLAVAVLLRSIWHQAGVADRAQDELDRRRNRRL